MPNTIKIKNSAVAAKVPLTTDLDYGELALNYADGKIFYKRSDNTVQSISGGGGGTGDVTLAGTQTLTNKTIDYASNTLTGVQPTLVSGTTIKTINSTSLLGSGDITISSGPSALTINNKTAAYTVVAGDLGKIVNCTSGTFTVSLTAAATLGAGFNCWIWNTGTGAVTIDPSGAETVDGIATLILRQGEGLQIVCDGTNFQTGDKKTMRGFAENISPTAARPTATGDGSTAIGQEAQATGQRAVALTFSRATGVESFAAANGSVAFGATGYGSVAIGGTSSSTNNFSIAIGQIARATNNRSLALGYNPLASGEFSAAIGRDTTASSTNATALGANSGNQGSQAVTGSGAMALGGSYASGVDSFAAAITNNTSTYGAVGNNSIAMGYLAKATVFGSISIGYLSSVPTGSAGMAVGYMSSATANVASAFGYASLSTIKGKYAYAGGQFAGGGTATGDSQTGTFVLRRATTDATVTVLTTENTAPGTDNQVILPNNSAYAFTGTIVARQQAAGGTQSAAWKVDGLIRREGTAASTVLVNSALTIIDNTPGWNIAFTADTTNGGLAVTVTGAAATNIRWVATMQTSEVTYA